MALAVRARKSPWIETWYPLHRHKPSRVRARKSPWIETEGGMDFEAIFKVRARKSPWIETDIGRSREKPIGSGLVRARGLKLDVY